MRLPVITLQVSEQRYSCHGCGNCCRDFTVELRPEDLAKIVEQKWESRLGEAVTVRFRGATFLRQREDGACIFLQPDGKCRIHAEFGLEAKPIACQLFPFSLVPGPGQVVAGVNFACQSVLENKGKSLSTHLGDLVSMQGELPESQHASQVLLSGRLVAEPREITALQATLDRWLRRRDVTLVERLEGFAWIAEQLLHAKLEAVRGQRFEDLLAVLSGALPEELDHLPVTAPTARQSSLLRQAIFARTEDPKIPAMVRRGRVRTVVGQWRRSRRFSRGRGEIPPIGAAWPRGGTLEAVEHLGPITASPDVDAAEDVVIRWLRATLLGGRAWGAGFYGWPMVDGTAALVLNLAATGWLARAHAVASRRAAPSIEDVRAAIGRIDRTAGRARWLGAGAERLRIEYLAGDHGLMRLVMANWGVSRQASDDGA